MDIYGLNIFEVLFNILKCVFQLCVTRYHKHRFPGKTEYSQYQERGKNGFSIQDARYILILPLFLI